MFGILAAIAFALAYLERPLEFHHLGEEKRRQIYICGSLYLLAISLAFRAMWSFQNISDFAPPYPSSEGLAAKYLERTAESFQYVSCLLMCWQWTRLCGDILNWHAKTFRISASTLVSMGTFFFFWEIGTCKIAYDPGTMAQATFDRYQYIFVSSFFLASAIAMLLLAHRITTTIKGWVAIATDSGDDEVYYSSAHSALQQTLRLSNFTWPIVVGNTIRAISWSTASVTGHNQGPYPW